MSIQTLKQEIYDICDEYMMSDERDKVMEKVDEIIWEVKNENTRISRKD